MDHLPIFLNLKNQPCLIVGGGVVAARKADLMLQAGAQVTVLAASLKQEMQSFYQQQKIHWQPQTLNAHNFAQQLAQLPRPKIVICATDDPQLNQAVSQTCRQQHILVNVADQTELCDFILPAIVDRNPITIAVSTGGRSPILARLIKSRLETLIPANYGKLAKLLGHIRHTVKAKIPSPDARKAFWERLLNSLFVQKILKNQTDEAQQLLQNALQQSEDSLKSTEPSPTNIGEVYLIGAGPGDPDLMTFKGLQLLQQADIILYDRLVSPEILNLARREAERRYVGKKAKDHSLPQPDINQLLITLAKAGKKVARLKGGDPYIFGRGAEEAEQLVKAGIPFEVVPGITAASGCATYAGFPLTHRDYSQSVTLITGHQQSGADPIDYGRLAQAGNTIVFYMGIKNAHKIQQNLIEQGLSPNTPTAIIEKGTTPQQRNHYTILNQLSNTIQQQNIHPPALIIIGKVIQIKSRLKTI